jgi:hypothetical protein
MGLAEVRVAQSDGWPLGAFVQGVLPEAVSAAVLVCAEDNKPNAKLTVQLRNEKGEILGYLKYAEKRVACRRLDQEYSVLSTLQKGLGPEVLKYGTLGNGTALLVTPILGRVLLSPLPPPEGVAAYLMSLVLSSPVPLEAHPWVQSIRERSSNVAQLDAWFDVLANRRWPVVVQHGDFAPWNLLRSPRGEIKAFDCNERLSLLRFCLLCSSNFATHLPLGTGKGNRTRCEISDQRASICAEQYRGSGSG